MAEHLIDALTSTPFAGRVGQGLVVEAATGELALEIFAVSEHPKSAGPNARRVPFTVTLRGPESPCLTDGCFHVRVDGDGGFRLEDVYLNRILPRADSDGSGAFYQMVFG